MLVYYFFIVVAFTTPPPETEPSSPEGTPVVIEKLSLNDARHIAFERVESKLFTPMAFTIGYALIGALVAALTLIPILSYLAYRRPGKIYHNPILTLLERIYHAVLRSMLARPWIALLLGLGATIAGIAIGTQLGREFLPKLDEGSIWTQLQLPPGISLEKAQVIASDFRNAIAEFPEVSYVTTQLGRDNNGTEPFTLFPCRVLYWTAPL